MEEMQVEERTYDADMRLSAEGCLYLGNELCNTKCASCRFWDRSVTPEQNRKFWESFTFKYFEGFEEEGVYT